ncbi:MAG TPA: DUF6152 family protein [Caulobacterales bacterium]|jgi:hypothetical protein|nr:DUF6152 family protein [Caulobacterales bacterium]
MKRIPVAFGLNKVAAAVLLTGVCAMASPAQAHHSAAMFDTTKTVTIKGTVKTIKWNNPHVYFEVMAADAAGAQTLWNIECSPPSILVRRGWSSHSLKAGDQITVQGNPLRDGGPAAFLINVTTASGATLKDHNY